MADTGGSGARGTEAPPSRLMNETPATGSPEAEEEDSLLRVASSTLLRTLSGVAVAVGASDELAKEADEWFSSVDVRHPPPLKPSELQHPPDDPKLDPRLKSWITVATHSSTGPKVGALSSVIHLTLAVAGLCSSKREGLPLTPEQLSSVISLIDDSTLYGFLSFQNALYDHLQRCIVVPLCVLPEEGGVQQRFELQLWLPDSGRTGTEPTILSHSSSVDYQVLDGVGIFRTHHVEATSDPVAATHVKYRYHSTEDAAGSPHVNIQWSPSLSRSDELVKTTETGLSVRCGDCVYSVPAASWHSIEVEPDTFHVVLVSYTSERSKIVLGPKGFKQESFRNLSAEEATSYLVASRALRVAEDLLTEGRQATDQLKMERALTRFNMALLFLNDANEISQRSRAFYDAIVLGEKGRLYRRCGRYEEAKQGLEKSLGFVEPLTKRVDLLGELAAVYMDMSLFEDARRTAGDQYETSRQLNYDPGMCVAVGLLGDIPYRMFQQSGEEELLSLAITRLGDYVDRAQLIQAANSGIVLSNSMDLSKAARIWESHGLARLSLCYTARGDFETAQSEAEIALDRALATDVPTAIAAARFVLGRVFLYKGQREEAMAQFTSPEGMVMPTVCCMQPSAELLGFLQELSGAGVAIHLTDPQGYSTLDHAVFNGSAVAQQIVLDSLHLEFGSDGEEAVEQLRREAVIRSDYRILLQEKLRPALFRHGYSRPEALEHARKVYAETLAADAGKASRLDELKFVWYSDFVRFGRLPRSSDGLTRKYEANAKGGGSKTLPKLIIFISYRWLHGDTGSESPDDGKNTQYHRTIEAIDMFLAGKATGLHYTERNDDFVKRYANNVGKDEIGIWMDYSCVDQDDPGKGVVALPLILTQCNVVISLVSEDYYTRAWCTVEAQMAQVLSRAGGGGWFEHRYRNGDQGEEATIQHGNKLPLTEIPGGGMVTVTPGRGRLTFEERDRPKVAFLERQARFLEWYEHD